MTVKPWLCDVPWARPSLSSWPNTAGQLLAYRFVRISKCAIHRLWRHLPETTYRITPTIARWLRRCRYSIIKDWHPWKAGHTNSILWCAQLCSARAPADGCWSLHEETSLQVHDDTQFEQRYGSCRSAFAILSRATAEICRSGLQMSATGIPQQNYLWERNDPVEMQKERAHRHLFGHFRTGPVPKCPVFTAARSRWWKWVLFYLFFLLNQGDNAI